MTSRVPGNIELIEDDKDWVLVLERTLNHPREHVWAALTEADQFAKWGPFRPDRDLTTTGPVRLQHLGMPEAGEHQGVVYEASAPHLLVLGWGDDILRWELRDEGDRTRLVLRHRFGDRKLAPSYAAGWHLCLDGLTDTAAGDTPPSRVGLNAMNHGWQELHDQYAERLNSGS